MHSTSWILFGCEESHCCQGSLFFGPGNSDHNHCHRNDHHGNDAWCHHVAQPKGWCFGGVGVLIMHRMWIVDVGAHFQPGFMTWRFNQPPFQDEPSPKKTRPYVSSYSCQPPLTSKGYYWWVPFRGGLVESQHDSDIQLPDAFFSWVLSTFWSPKISTLFSGLICETVTNKFAI